MASRAIYVPKLQLASETQAVCVALSTGSGSRGQACGVGLVEVMTIAPHSGRARRDWFLLDSNSFRHDTWLLLLYR